MTEFIEPKVSPTIAQLIKGAKARIQFYSVPRHFKQVKVKWELRQFAGSYFWKLLKCLWHDFMAEFGDLEYEQHANKQELINAIHTVFDEWIERLGGNKVHGGERPDASDFRMYAELMRVETLPIMKGIMAKRPRGCKFTAWYKLMVRSCAQQIKF